MNICLAGSFNPIAKHNDIYLVGSHSLDVFVASGVEISKGKLAELGFAFHFV